MEIKESLSLEEQIPYDSQKENQTNIKSKSKIKSHHKNDPNYSLINKPQKRARDYSPEMDLEDEEEEINNTNNINKNIKKHNNKRMKLPLTKFVERLTLNDPDENPKNKVSKSVNKSTSNKKKKRGIKIFSDMSISEISNNLFKNYYPCILPEYYMDQISEQIIKNQIDKLSSNFLKEKKEEVKNKKIKINQNMDYLRELAEKQGEWVDYEQNNKKKNIQKSKKSRGIKIFSDMSVSEISNNLFKNYYPCILPEYYPEQITQQIIENQIEKLVNNFNKEKKIDNKKIKIERNMDYLRELAEKQGEWVDEQNDNVIYNDNIEEENENKSYDSNSENNSKNSYPEDESLENEDDEDNYDDKEQNFEDEYNYYENENNDDNDYDDE